jgi:hypothetical protein
MATNTTSNTSASRVIRGIKDSVSGQVEDQKHRAAEGIVGMADAVRRLSDEIRGHNEALANAVNSAGSRLNAVADRVREADPAEIAQVVARFARQRPVLFVGAAFVVGLGVSQLLKTASMTDGSTSQGRASSGSLRDLSESSVGA